MPQQGPRPWNTTNHLRARGAAMWGRGFAKRTRGTMGNSYMKHAFSNVRRPFTTLHHMGAQLSKKYRYIVSKYFLGENISSKDPFTIEINCTKAL